MKALAVLALIGCALVLRAAHRKWRAWPLPDDWTPLLGELDRQQMEAFRRQYP